MVLEGSETGFVKEKAKEVVKDPKIGRVVQVYEHLVPDDDSNFEVDVVIDGDTFEERAVSYNGESSGQMAAPKVGDKVIIDYLAGNKKRPVCMGTVYTDKDRAPLGRAGMQRDVYESDESPVGPGDLTVTGYTQYTDNPARVDKDEIDPVQVWYQIAKFPQSPDPVLSDNAPFAFEVYDSPVSEEDETRIRAVGNQIDGDDTKSLDWEMNFKDGIAKTEAINTTSGMTTKVEQDVKNDLLTLLANDGSNDYTVDFDPSVPSITVQSSGSSEAGFKVNFNTGEVKMVDGAGYGIESDGSGNFTWHHSTIDMSEGTTTSL